VCQSVISSCLTVSVSDVAVGCSVGEDWIVDLLSVHGPTANTSVSDVSDQSSLLQHIEANFTAAAQLYAADVGALHWVESLQMRVAFFVFSDATDKHLKARNRLPGGPQIHRCDVNAICFTQTHFGRRLSSSAFEREREFRNLLNFLSSLSYGRVHVFPHEKLLCADSAASVCDRLRRHLLTSSTSTSSTAASLVFVQMTSSSLVEHLQLLHRVFNYSQDELLTARHSVYIVTDVGPTVRLNTLDGLLECSSSYIHTTVYSGAKPMFSPISCIVIALHLSCS